MTLHQIRLCLRIHYHCILAQIHLYFDKEGLHLDHHQCNRDLQKFKNMLKVTKADPFHDRNGIYTGRWLSNFSFNNAVDITRTGPICFQSWFTSATSWIVTDLFTTVSILTPRRSGRITTLVTRVWDDALNITRSTFTSTKTRVILITNRYNFSVTFFSLQWRWRVTLTESDTWWRVDASLFRSVSVLTQGSSIGITASVTRIWNDAFNCARATSIRFKSWFTYAITRIVTSLFRSIVIETPRLLKRIAVVITRILRNTLNSARSIIQCWFAHAITLT